jgi:hypothetical protein
MFILLLLLFITYLESKKKETEQSRKEKGVGGVGYPPKYLYRKSK